MGYELRLYIVQKSTLEGYQDTEGMFYGEIISMFNLCKMNYEGVFHKACNSMRYTDCYIYSDDGHTPIIKDKYDERLREINIKPLIKILEKENQEYRRMKPVINLLKGFDINKYHNIMVLVYGY